MIDDMIDTGGTIFTGAKVLLEKGARRFVSAALTLFFWASH